MPNAPEAGLPSLFDQACERALTQHAEGPRVFALLHIGGSRLSPASAAADDSVAAMIERRIALVMRGGDVVCRQGQQDVVCLVTELRDSAEAHAIARLLMRSMALSPSVMPSIGIALFPRDGERTLPLLDHAAAALAHARISKLGIAALTDTATGPVMRPAPGTATPPVRDGRPARKEPRLHGR